MTRRSWLTWALGIPVAVAVVITVLGFFGASGAMLEAFTNARLQLLLAGVVLGLIAVVARRFGIAVFAAAVMIVNATYVAPFLLPASADALPESPADVFRVMQYNVYFGNQDIDAIAEHVRSADADVVVLHELTAAQWQGLERLLARDYQFSDAVTVDKHQGQLGGGMAVLTRSATTSRLPVPDELSPKDRVMMAVTTVAPSGEEVLVVGLHPHASRHEDRKVALREQQMAGTVELVAAWNGPAMIVTDMNLAPTSPVYADFLDELDWRDPHRTVGWKSTWPSWGGPFGMPIDHVLVSNGIALHSYTIGDGAGSDHKSVTAELSMR